LQYYFQILKGSLGSESVLIYHQITRALPSWPKVLVMQW
jgi:hypothetical protein